MRVLLCSLLVAAVLISGSNGYMPAEQSFLSANIVNNLYKQLANQTQLAHLIPYATLQVNFPNSNSLRADNFSLHFDHLVLNTSGFEWIPNGPDAKPFAPERMQMSIQLDSAQPWTVQMDVTSLNAKAKAEAALHNVKLHLVVQYATDAEFRNSHNPPFALVNSSLTAKVGEISVSSDRVFNSSQEKQIFISGAKWDLEGGFLKNFQLEGGVGEVVCNFFKSRYYTVTQYLMDKFVSKLRDQKELSPLALPGSYQASLNGSAELGHFVLHRSNLTYQALSYRYGISFLNESEIVRINWLPDAEWLHTSLDIYSTVHPEWNAKDVQLWSKLSGEFQLQVNLDDSELHAVNFSVVQDKIFLEYYFDQAKVDAKVGDAVKHLVLPTVRGPAFAKLKADLLDRFKSVVMQQIRDDLKGF